MKKIKRFLLSVHSAVCSPAGVWGQHAHLQLTTVRREQKASYPHRTSPRSRNLRSSSPANPPVEQQACQRLEAAETVARRQTDWRRVDN